MHVNFGIKLKMSEEINNEVQQDLTGNFEQDYTETCRRLGIKPFNVLKFGLPLPPLPYYSPQNVDTTNVSVADDMRRSKLDLTGDSNLLGKYGGRASQDSQAVSAEDHYVEATPNIKSNPPGGIHSDEGNHVSATTLISLPARSTTHAPKSHSEKTKRSMPDLSTSTTKLRHSRIFSIPNINYQSRFKFSPTIDVESNEYEYEEEVYKIEVRGWKVSIPTMEAINLAITACSTITHLNFWNCGLTESHANLLATAIPTVNIRTLALDQNPSIPESFYSSFLGDDSMLKSLSLRGNGISDIGVKSFSAALKVNRSLSNLNLWDNRITKDGAEILAESLRFGCNLQVLSLGKNTIGDEGAASFAKCLSNYLLTQEELQNRRKQLAEMDRLRHDMEDDTASKKKNRAGRGASAKPFDDKKDDKGKAKPKPLSKKGLDVVATQRPIKTPDDKNKKMVSNGTDDRKGKDKKCALPTKVGKKVKLEDTKEDMDENMESASSVEPMFEFNGQWYLLGNRTLNSLNLSHNGIGMLGLKALSDAIIEQETTNDQSPDGLLGVFRLNLQYNSIDAESVQYQQLVSLLNTRNPFFEIADSEVVQDGAISEQNEIAQSDNGSLPDDITQQ
ncbi:hypothetical protein RTP6_007665 [Batrachochytrium dendrobatidis]